MLSTLYKYLEKLNIKTPNDLPLQERLVWDRWYQIAVRPAPTVADFAAFLRTELDVAHSELRNYENSAQKQLFYQAYSRLCQRAVSFLEMPDKDRQVLAKQIEERMVKAKGRSNQPPTA